MELEYCNEIISNYRHEFVEMKEEFLGIVSFAKGAHSLGSSSFSEDTVSIAFLPYIIDLTILNAITISFGSYRFQFLHR